MVLIIKDIAKKAGIAGPDLLTRPLARKIYKKALKKLMSVLDGETVVCDFENIEVIDPSFVDEFLVKMINDGKENDSEFFVRIKNLSKSGEQNIYSVFENYESFSKVRLSVVTEELTEKNTHVIGRLNPEEKELVETLRVNGEMKSEQLASALGINLIKVKELLNSLNKMRIIKLVNDSFVLV